MELLLNQRTHRIETARVLLRRPEPSDLVSILEIHQHEDVNRYLPHPWKTSDDASAWLARGEQRFRDNTGLQLLVVDASSQNVIGACVLFDFDLETGMAEIGYVLGHRYWGHGYAKEVLHSLIDYAFGTLGFRRLVGLVDTRNHASQSLLLKLGFIHEGTMREDFMLKGELASTQVYGLLSREWRR